MIHLYTFANLLVPATCACHFLHLDPIYHMIYTLDPIYQVLEQPLFWSDETRFQFLCAVGKERPM